MEIQLINPNNRLRLWEENGYLKDAEHNVFPLVQGSYRFVNNSNYANNFGFQWNRFTKSQIDKINGINLSKERLFAVTGWENIDLSGENILEAGSGAGRFTDVLLKHTQANIYSLDYSDAVDANFRNNGPHPRLKLFQADIYQMPFRPSSFDRVICFGVLQHTPDVKKSIQCLIKMARPGGEVIVDFYPYNGWWTKINAKYILRPFLKNITHERLLKLIENNINWMMWLSRLAVKLKIDRIVNRFIPVCDIRMTLPGNLTQQELREWAVLDTFDMFSPAYDQPQRLTDVKKWFEEMGMEQIFAGQIVYGNNNKVVVVKGIKSGIDPNVIIRNEPIIRDTAKIPKVSIALTAYNQEPFIAEALDSILSQKTNFDFEIVIGEDCSTDRTREILQDYAARFPGIIRVIFYPANMGYVKNFDFTLRNCKGKYVAIFDGDDIMLPGKLQKQVDFLDTHPDMVMVGHDVLAVSRDALKHIRLITPRIRKAFYTIEDLAMRGSFFANSSKMFRKECLPRDPIDPGIKFIADWYITLEIVGEGQIGYIWETLARYRVHADSIMQKLRGKDDFEDKKLTIERINRKYHNKYARHFRNQWAYVYMIYGMDELFRGLVRPARRKLLKSMSEKYNYSFGQYFYFLLTFFPSPLRNIFIQLKNLYVRY